MYPISYEADYVRERNRLTTFFRLILAIPFAFPWMFGKMAGSVKQGLAVLSAMVVLWLTISLVAMVFEANGNSKLNNEGVSQAAVVQGLIGTVKDRSVIGAASGSRGRPISTILSIRSG